MYSLAVCVFIVVLSGTALLSGRPNVYLDFPSLVVVFGFSLPLLMASGLGKDLLVAFKVAMSGENTFKEVDLKRALIAMQLYEKLILVSGFFGTVMGSIAFVIRTEGQVNLVGFAVASMTTLYSGLILLFLLPIEAKIKAYLTLEE